MQKLFPDPPAHIHCIGIKGVGMTALAEILQGQGYHVTGSDVDDVFPTDAVLARLGIHCEAGFAAEHIGPTIAAVVYSTAYPDNHVERVAAREAGIPEWSYPEMLGLLFTLYEQGIAVAGSHGKTTTAAMLARMLEDGGCDPTAIVGSTLVEWGRNARLGNGSWFVVETDEYQNKFAHYAPRYILLTNVDYDHPDFFADAEAYERVFTEFVGRLPANGALVMWGDEPHRAQVTADLKARLITYGMGAGNDWRLSDVTVTGEGTRFVVTKYGEPYGTFTIPFAGEHYALDATGAMVIADLAGVSATSIERTLRLFRGTARRLEHKGTVRGAIIIDDYGHHPTEIAITLKGLRQQYPERKLRCVFHPHTFTRTATFLKEFAAALNVADEVIVPAIFGSAREVAGTVSHEDLVREINALTPGKARAVDTLDEARELLEATLDANDVIVTMGAGDNWKVGEALGHQYV